jgi:hypothetical protein
MVANFLFAEVNLDELKAKHLDAMKNYGRSDVMNDGKMFFVAMGQTMGSVFMGNELSTGYVENGDKKFYWEITPVEGGIKITIKIEILGKVYEKSFIIKLADREVAIQGEGTQDRYDWLCIVKCVGSAAFKCISCMKDWQCWAKCAGPDIVSCVMGCF